MTSLDVHERFLLIFNSSLNLNQSFFYIFKLIEVLFFSGLLPLFLQMMREAAAAQRKSFK